MKIFAPPARAPIASENMLVWVGSQPYIQDPNEIVCLQAHIIHELEIAFERIELYRRYILRDVRSVPMRNHPSYE